MATIASRLTNTGTLLVNGAIDEVTFSSTTPTITNLLTSSQDFLNASWGPGAYQQYANSVVITSNVATAPNGTLTASKFASNNATATYYSFFNYGSAVPANVSYTFSSYFKSAERTAGSMVLYTTGYNNFIGFDLSAGTVTYVTPTDPALTMTGGISSVGNGWYRVYYTFRSTATQSTAIYKYGLDQGGLSVGQGIYIWGAQLELGTAPSIYQPIGNGILINPTWSVKTVPSTVYATGQFDEVTYNTATPAIKNLFKYTETFYFDYVNWTLNGGRMTQNATLAPDGRSLAPKLIEDTVLGNQRIYNWHAVTAGTTYTYSIFLKPAERYIIRCYFEDTQTGGGGRVGQYLNLQTGTIISTYQTGSNTLLGSNLQYIDNGWYRYSWTVQAQQTAALNSTSFVIFGMGLDSATFNWTGDGTSGMYIWGAQKEISTAVTSYQGIGATTLVTPNFARREDRTGNMYVTNSYDEFTGAPVVDSSLQWWFDGGQTTSYSGSGAQIRNLSNVSQTGTMYGNVTYSSNAGGQFVFNNYLDTTNYITAGNVGYPTSFNDPWTAEAWIFVPTGATWSNGVNKGALYLRGSYAGVHGLMRTTNDNQVGIVLRGNTTTQAERYGTTVRNQWNQVVGVWTGGAGGNLQCYVNGTLTASGTTTQDDPIELAYWLIGGNNGVSGASGSVFEGNISGVKLYTRALTADEVAQNFNALRRRYNI